MTIRPRERDSEADHPWRDRFQAVGRAQTQYLYALGMAGLFFFALDLALPDTLTTELLGIPISAQFVWATAPSTLGFLLAAAMGSITATGHASEQMKLGRGEFEREDTMPNALDMAAYTTQDSPRVALALGWLTYSTYLSLFLLEGVWLWWKLLMVENREPPLQVALVVGGGMLILGSMRLPAFVRERLKRCWNTLRHGLPSTGSPDPNAAGGSPPPRCDTDK